MIILSDYYFFAVPGNNVVQVFGVPPGAVSGGPGFLPVPPQPEVPGPADGRDSHGVEQRSLHLQPRHGQHPAVLVCLVALNKDV